jgi:hypothetical protein
MAGEEANVGPVIGASVRSLDRALRDLRDLELVASEMYLRPAAQGQSASVYSLDPEIVARCATRVAAGGSPARGSAFATRDATDGEPKLAVIGGAARVATDGEAARVAVVGEPERVSNELLNVGDCKKCMRHGPRSPEDLCLKCAVRAPRLRQV